MEKYVPGFYQLTLPDKQLGNRSLAFLLRVPTEVPCYLRYISPRYRRTARIGDAAVALAVKTLTSTQKGQSKHYCPLALIQQRRRRRQNGDMFAVCFVSCGRYGIRPVK
jgi:hypothetical protein